VHGNIFWPDALSAPSVTLWVPVGVEPKFAGCKSVTLMATAAPSLVSVIEEEFYLP